MRVCQLEVVETFLECSEFFLMLSLQLLFRFLLATAPGVPFCEQCGDRQGWARVFRHDDLSVQSCRVGRKRPEMALAWVGLHQSAHSRTPRETQKLRFPSSPPAYRGINVTDTHA
jgi:hypothetical protein